MRGPSSIASIGLLLAAGCRTTPNVDAQNDAAIAAAVSSSSNSGKNKRPHSSAPFAHPSASAAPAQTESSFTFKVATTTFKTGHAIHVTFDPALRAPSKNRFWITIIDATAPESDWGDWHYSADGATQDTLSAPAPGDYEIRLHDAFPMFPFRVMSRQRITAVACRASSDCPNGSSCDNGVCKGAPRAALRKPAPPAADQCENEDYVGTFCSLGTGFKGYCNRQSYCENECAGGMGLAPDGQCYPACPAGGFCGDGCSCQWNVCVCPPGD